MRRYSVASIGLALLMASGLTSSAWGLTDIYFGLDDGTALETPGPVLGHYVYDPTTLAYSLTGIESLPAGTTADNIALNATPGTGGGIYAGLVGTTNVVREYSFSGSTFANLRETAARVGDFGMGPDNRLYGFETVSGSLVNFAASGATFTQTATSLGAANGNVQVAVGRNNQIIAAGRDSTDQQVNMKTFSFDGTAFTETSFGQAPVAPTSIAVSAFDKTIWMGSSQNTEFGLRDRMLQFAFVEDIPGGEDGCTGSGPGHNPCAVGTGDIGSTADFLEGIPEITDLTITSDGLAIGISEDFNAGPDFGGRGTYLLGWLGDPSSIDSGGLGSGQIGLKIASRIGPVDTRFDMTIDHEDTIHVLGGGMLQAWEIVDDDANYANGALFQAVAVTGGGLLDPPSAIAAAPGVFLPPQSDGDYNENGVVDAADYVVWRNTLDQSVTPGSGADGNGNGLIDEADYGFWRARFGNNVGGGSSTIATVPEPTVAILIASLLITGSYAIRLKTQQ